LTVSRCGGKGRRLVPDRRPHPLPRLLDAGVAEADQVEHGLAGAHVDLHLHDLALEPAEHAAEN